jgi:DNA-binding CsgD family transcriptional regulator/PAS domain-containing protein
MPHVALVETFSKVVDDLYAGALDNATWNHAFLAMSDMVRASGALLMAFNPSTGAVLRGESYRLDPSVLRDYERYWCHEDPRVGAGLFKPPGSPVTEQTLEIAKWQRSAILNEFLIPSDVPHFMPAWLRKADTKFVTLSFQGTRKRGPFEPEDLETYRLLLPHVNRALEIRDRLEQAKINSATVSATLETARFGVIVLDSSGRLLETNHIAQGIIGCNGNGIQRKADGTLWCREPAGTQLSRWIVKGSPPTQSIDGLLQVAREYKAPISILVMPLPRQLPSWINADPKWLLLIFDPEVRMEADAPLIAKDLHISAREAELAARLLAGENLPAIARRFGVSHNTVRVQLKSIYKKTGIRSQAELVRRLALGPAVSLKVEAASLRPR